MNKTEAREYMRGVVQEHVDRRTGEVNYTSLAEECADHFGANDEDGPLDDDTHWLWDLSVEVGDEFDAQRARNAKGGV